MNGKRNFLPATVDKNGVGNETLAFHAVKAVTLWDLDVQKLLAWMKPVYNANEGMVFQILALSCFSFPFSLKPQYMNWGVSINTSTLS